jgi:Transposase.
VIFIVHHEYAPQDQAMTKLNYRNVLRRLRDAVRHKRPELWLTGNWRLHHNNALAHSSHLIQTYFGENRLWGSLSFQRYRYACFFPRPKIGYFSNNENSTREPKTTSPKCCLPSTHAIDTREKSRMRMMVQGRLMQARFIAIHLVFATKRK